MAGQLCWVSARSMWLIRSLRLVTSSASADARRVAPIRAVDQGLEQGFVQPDGDRDGSRCKHGAVKPAGEQTGANDDRAQYARWNQRARGGQPQQHAAMAAQPGNDLRVDRMVEPV